MRFAFVASRYGAEISSGAEHACRLLAEHVCERHNVDVLTTCARDPLSWKNEYTEGTDRVRGVLVRRFAVNQTHDRAAFDQLSSRMLGKASARADEREWVRRLGPSSPALIDYLKRQARSYDAIAFFSLYPATTVTGLTAVPDRSVLFPYLRLDPALRFGIWSEIMHSARGIGYVSSAEQKLAREYLRTRPASEEVVGMGIDMPAPHTYPRHQQDPADVMADEDEPDSRGMSTPAEYLARRGVLFRRRHRLYGSFVLYAGRAEPDNGSEEMLEYFDSYATGAEDAVLLLTGIKMMSIPSRPYVRLAGVLPERERLMAYEAADVTIAPDPDDLEATAVLESFAVGTPVLASARNEAAVDLCRRANAGLYYANRAEFVEALRMLMTDTRLRERLGANGLEYVRQHHRWDAVTARFERLAAHAKRS